MKNEHKGRERAALVASSDTEGVHLWRAEASPKRSIIERVTDLSIEEQS